MHSLPPWPAALLRHLRSHVHVLLHPQRRPPTAAVAALPTAAGLPPLSLPAAAATLPAVVSLSDPERRRCAQAEAAGGGDKEAVRAYFNSTGFERWREIYGSMMKGVNKSKLLIRNAAPRSRFYAFRRIREDEGKEQRYCIQASDMEGQFQDGKEEVIQAWYMDDSEEDQRLPHHREPKEFIPLDKLSELGILSWRLNANDWENDENLKKIREARGYSYMDICDVCPEKLPNYEAKLKNFFEEHLHTDEEIRYCLEGSGYFDVRDQNDQWIRIAVKKGGMIVLPAGMYHRFTLDSDNYIKAMRLFVGEPVWTPYNRPHDHLPARKEYVDRIINRGRNEAVEAR
ncbi:hypothetical protein U9M48_006215 [Paspalum notatum var. saurae]|uniref:Acireductone dioxygenase n=1 Tax=Paspalum notatum var. saurae TaxID=547442 RepID=A0AAQ3PNJ2_PASNO